jgi:CheY-like chemotaxis protein
MRVIDTGAGIAAEHLSSIFDEFFQLRNPERDRSKGSGLGLAICKRLVDAMGCAVAVESTCGEGSTFTLTIPAEFVLPLTRPAAARPPEPPPLPPRSNGPGPLLGVRILLVEDHELTRRTAAQLLTDEGAILLQAPCADVAMHLLFDARPDVLLLDLMLPDMDGREILKAVAVRRPASLKCVLAITGDVTAARQEEVLALGADALIPKPVDVESLVQVLATTLRAAADAIASPAELGATAT